MSTEQEDAALMLDLQERITNRIRAEILTCANGFEPTAADPEDTKHHASFVNQAIVNGVAMRILNNPTFVANLTRAVVQKLSTANIY